MWEIVRADTGLGIRTWPHLSDDHSSPILATLGINTGAIFSYSNAIGWKWISHCKCKSLDMLISGVPMWKKLPLQWNKRGATCCVFIHKDGEMSRPFSSLHRMTPFNRQIIQSEFSPTWNCVSLTRSTTSSEWKLFRFDRMEVNCFQILLIDVTFYLKHI